MQNVYIRCHLHVFHSLKNSLNIAMYIVFRNRPINKQFSKDSMYIRQYECVRRKFPNGNVDEKSITFTRLRQETNMIGYRYENKFLTVLINTFTNIKKTDNHH